jgi:3-oxoacyl-[acyl-carrier-protein] synthase I
VATRFPRARLGIVLGTSTSGISSGEAAIAQWSRDETLPSDYHYAQQEMGVLAPALQQHLGWQGPAFCISTACSASAKAMASGQRLLQAGLCDAVLVGGVDSLCRLTLNGFDALESLSATRCRPLSRDRDGINIGEAAAFFLLTRESAEVNLLGAGESSDAWHISAPHPEGRGAAAAMQRALQNAGLNHQALHYLNLHGTATTQNDAMEARAIHRLFLDAVPVSGTKHLTGHCLGAAGALEAGLACVLLADGNMQLPAHPDFLPDPELPVLQTTTREHRLPSGPARIMSNSFAFGGSNIALILGRD